MEGCLLRQLGGGGGRRWEDGLGGGGSVTLTATYWSICGCVNCGGGGGGGGGRGGGAVWQRLIDDFHVVVAVP